MLKTQYQAGPRLATTRFIQVKVGGARFFHCHSASPLITSKQSLGKNRAQVNILFPSALSCRDRPWHEPVIRVCKMLIFYHSFYITWLAYFCKMNYFPSTGATWVLCNTHATRRQEKCLIRFLLLPPSRVKSWCLVTTSKQHGKWGFSKIGFFRFGLLLLGNDFYMRCSINCSPCFWSSNCSNFGQWAFLQAGSHVLVFLGYFLTFCHHAFQALIHSQLLMWPEPFPLGALVPLSGEYLEVKIWWPRILLLGLEFILISLFQS